MSATVNLEAEMAVLGSILMSRVHARRLTVTVDPAWFYRDAHRLIFSAVKALCEVDDPVDFLTVKTKLGPNLENAGGEDYLIQVCEFVPSAANGDYYSELVKECFIRRQILDRIKKLAGRAIDQELSTEALVSEARELISGIESPRNPIINVADVKIGEGGDLGIPSGYPGLDRSISTGGYPTGQITVVSAYHKGGKTAFMSGSALSILEEGGRILWATFDDLSAEQLKRRMVRQMCGWSKRPTVASYVSDYEMAMHLIDGYDLDFYDGALDDGGGTVEAFAGYAEAQHSRTPYTAIFCDYWQVMTTMRKCNSDERELGEISRILARMSRRLSIPAIVGAQITEGRAGEKTRTKGGRSIEEKAGLVLRLDRETEQVEIPYSRFGGSGTNFPIQWDKYKERHISE